jgi:hypothetical protein
MPLMNMHERRLQMKGEEANFILQKSTGIGVKGGERKHRFIENNITRDIHATSRNIETLVDFMETTIPKKHTLF